MLSPRHFYERARGVAGLTISAHALAVYVQVLERGSKGVLQYRVRWRNFGEDADTWEPLQNLSTALDLVSEFEVKIWRENERAQRCALALAPCLATRFEQMSAFTREPTNENSLCPLYLQGATGSRCGAAPSEQHGPHAVDRRGGRGARTARA